MKRKKKKIANVEKSHELGSGKSWVNEKDMT